MSSNYTLGRKGEEIAANYLLNKGFSLITRNFQYYREGTQGRLGEIDLIVEKGGKLHLVEVKSRSNAQFGLPEEQITAAKLRYLYRTYQYFLLKNKKYQNYFCQLDVVCIKNDEIEVIQNAYSFEGIIR